MLGLLLFMRGRSLLPEGAQGGSKIFMREEGTMGAEVLGIHEEAGSPSRWGSWEDSEILSRPRGRLGGGNAAPESTVAGPSLFSASKP